MIRDGFRRERGEEGYCNPIVPEGVAVALRKLRTGRTKVQGTVQYSSYKKSCGVLPRSTSIKLTHREIAIAPEPHKSHDMYKYVIFLCADSAE